MNDTERHRVAAVLAQRPPCEDRASSWESQDPRTSGRRPSCPTHNTEQRQLLPQPSDYHYLTAIRYLNFPRWDLLWLGLAPGEGGGAADGLAGGLAGGGLVGGEPGADPAAGEGAAAPRTLRLAAS